MSASYPTTVSGDEQPSKRLRRSADDLAISSLVKTHEKPPQSALPESVYLVTVTTYHWDQKDTGVDSVYITREDAVNAAWHYILGECPPDAQIREVNSTNGLPTLELDGDFDDESSTTAQVEQVKLWPAGSVARAPPYRATITAAGHGRSEGNNDHGHSDGDSGEDYDD